jgi:hypothetical protein
MQVSYAPKVAPGVERFKTRWSYQVSGNAVHFADISVRSCGAGFSLRRTSVRLPQVSHDLREVGLKTAAD